MISQFYLLSNWWVRAGGAGGGHSSGGGGGHYGGGGGSGGGDFFLFEIIFSLIRMGPVGWVILLVIAYVVYWLYRQGSSNRNVGSATDFGYETGDPQAGSPVRPDGGIVSPVDLSVLDGEPLANFQNKVTQAFVTIQDAWSHQRADSMRRFISDGVYQRFHAQFTMMNLLGQRNPITEVQVLDVKPVRTAIEGGYQCMDVRVRASATDQFICERFPGLSSPGGNEDFTEYWSFIRRVDYKRGLDLFHSEVCPSCSAPLTSKLVETAKCPYCGVYLNSGEYDWVLSEITQENDYGHQIPSQFGLSEIDDAQINQVVAVYPEFSVQVIEDRASNAFMQILIGIATHNLDALKKFTNDPLFAQLTGSISTQQYVYDRLYTRAVDLLRVEVSGQEVHAFVAVEYDFHQIDLAHASPNIRVPDVLTTDTKVLKLVRTLSNITTKGSVFAGTCPQCGAPTKDSLSVTCQYCGVVFNDSRLDWVVEELLDMRNYRTKPT